MSKDIQIDSKGVRFSYSRFLADSAAGFIWILIAASVYYSPAFNSRPSIGTESKTITALMLFLLSTPVGLATNALTHALLEPVITARKRRFILSESFFVQSTWRAHEVEKLKKFFNLESGSKEDDDQDHRWRTTVNFIEKVFWLYNPAAIENLFFLEGLAIFLRNLAFLAPFCATTACVWYAYAIGGLNAQGITAAVIFWILAASMACFILMTLGASSAFYFEVQILSRAFILCRLRGRETVADVDEVARIIAQASLLQKENRGNEPG